MDVKIDFRGVANKIQKIGSNRDVGMYMASETYRHMIQYVPMDTGMLYQNITLEPFEIHFNSDYAKRVFEGDQLNFSKEKHPNAQAHWDIPTRNHREAIAKAVTTYIRSLR